MNWRVDATITCRDETAAAILVALLSQLARDNDAVPVELHAHPVKPPLSVVPSPTPRIGRPETSGGTTRGGAA